MTRPSHTYRVECGACGHRRAWSTGTAFMPDGRVAGHVTPNSPGGPLDGPCPACGTTDRAHVRRCWVKPGPELDENIPWRYVGIDPPRQKFPTGLWPEPVQLADVTYPDPLLGPHADQHHGELPPVGGQLTIAVVVAA